MLYTTPREIQTLFDELAPTYDRFNAMSSLGFDRVWRKSILSHVHPGMSVLDVGTGTGDLAIGARRNGAKRVVALDISQAMLNVARQKAKKAGCQIEWCCQSAADYEYNPNTYDVIVSGFVLRNIRSDLNAIMQGIYRALKPGGRIAFVDLTEPDVKFVRPFTSLYMRGVVALWGKLLFKSHEPVDYLQKSMQVFLRAPEFVQLLRQMHFREIHTKQYMAGMITQYVAVK